MKTNSPAITVLIPVYNRSDYLGKAIESILNQTNIDFELLIIDNASTDDSVEIIKSYKDERIRLVINEKNFGQSFSMNKGIKIARKLLLDFAEMGMPSGHEHLDLISPQYLSDIVSWGAIGARTTESQTHRELASGLSCPVGFKNGTDGSIQIAVDAIKAASRPHNFLSVTKEGKSAIFSTTGNKDCHIILRGGQKENYSALDIQSVVTTLEKNKLNPIVMIDASHANSQKDYKKQKIVVNDISEQIINGNKNIIGMMIESNLVEGKQNVDKRSNLLYGQSITDACIGWDETEELIMLLDNVMKKNNQ